MKFTSKLSFFSPVTDSTFMSALTWQSLINDHALEEKKPLELFDRVRVRGFINHV